MNLDQAVCIVTGSSSGVGAATAKMMAARGARVVINYSRSEAAAGSSFKGDRSVAENDLIDDPDDFATF